MSCRVALTLLCLIISMHTLSLTQNRVGLAYIIKIGLGQNNL